MSKIIYLCPYCKSHRVYQDAYVAVNCDDVYTYDDMTCLACGEEVRTPLEFALPEGFDGDLRDPDLVLPLEE